jgi:hypothetical protein
LGTLQEILISLGNDQKLGPGYLTPVGTPVPTALQTVRALRQQFDPWVLVSNPLPGMTNVPSPNVLFNAAYVANQAGQPTGIYLDGVDGNLDMSHGTKQPAYVFVS